MKNVIIAGGGVIGAAAALELAEHGAHVTLLERGEVLREASWAAAGMLAAEDPENPSELRALSKFSLSLYPAFLRRLQALSGKTVRLRTANTLQVVERSSAELQPWLAGRVLRAAEAAAAVPGLLLREDQSALWLEEQSLDPRELCAALRLSLPAAGVDVREHAPVLAVRESGQQVVVETPQGSLHTDALIVATGAWACQATSMGTEAPALHVLPYGGILPRKGQMLRLRLPQGTQFNAALRSREVYLVPRGNGSVVLGATVEDAAFDRTIRPEANYWLLEQAARLWQPIGSIGAEQIEDTWTGIRPGTQDGLPILGSLGHPRIFFATGHYRNGILLAPGTAQVIRKLITHERPVIDLRPFDARRVLHLCASQSMPPAATVS